MSGFQPRACYSARSPPLPTARVLWRCSYWLSNSRPSCNPDTQHCRLSNQPQPGISRPPSANEAGGRAQSPAALGIHAREEKHGRGSGGCPSPSRSLLYPMSPFERDEEPSGDPTVEQQGGKICKGLLEQGGGGSCQGPDEAHTNPTPEAAAWVGASLLARPRGSRSGAAAPAWAWPTTPRAGSGSDLGHG